MVIARLTTSRRREFEGRVVIFHEAAAGDVAQVGPLAADRLGDQVPRAAGDVEHGRMKLDEFHVADFRPRAEADGMPVGRGNFGVGGLTIEPARTARGEHRLLGPDEGFPMIAAPNQRPRQEPSCVKRSMVNVASQI